MKAKWTSLVDEASGKLDSRLYARHIPGNGEWAERRAIWQARYNEAKRQASKHNKPIQGRLCDYVKHEVSMALKKGEEIA